MKKACWRKRLVITAAIIVGLMPANAGAINVVIPGLLQLIPDICASLTGCDITYTNATKATELEILQGVIDGVTPTAAGWATNPVTMAPLLTTAVGEYNAYSAQVEANTGAPPAPNEALTVAEDGMAQLPQDEDDLTNAQTASDACDGDLCAQQSGHRFQQLQTTNAYEQKQFDYAKYVEEKKGEMAAAAWMTSE